MGLKPATRHLLHTLFPTAHLVLWAGSNMTTAQSTGCTWEASRCVCFTTDSLDAWHRAQGVPRSNSLHASQQTSLMHGTQHRVYLGGTIGIYFTTDSQYCTTDFLDAWHRAQGLPGRRNGVYASRQTPLHGPLPGRAH